MARKRPNISDFYQYNVDVDTRTIYLGSVSHTGEDTGTDFAMTESAIKGLILLDSSAPNGDAPINIVMNNHGGDVYHGLAIYDAIKLCKNETKVLVFGHAMSMGSVIMQAADRRIMAPHSTMMIHVGTDGFNGHAIDVVRKVCEGQRLDLLIEDIYLAKMQEADALLTRNKLKKLLQFDTYLSPQDAISLGLADEVLTNG